MPRKRSVGTGDTGNTEPQGVQAIVSQEPTTNTNSNTTVTKGESRIMAMTADQIQTLLQGTRQKGQYLGYLNEFLASGEAGVCANEQWIALKDKKATTISQGFKNAKDNKAAADGSENVLVLSNDDKVYLINSRVAGVEADAQAEGVAA